MLCDKRAVGLRRSRALRLDLYERLFGSKSAKEFADVMELDLGLDEDDWNSIAGNLLKDFNKNIRNVAINNVENSVNLGDFLSELQSLRDEKKRRHPKDDNSVEKTHPPDSCDSSQKSHPEAPAHSSGMRTRTPCEPEHPAM